MPNLKTTYYKKINDDLAVQHMQNHHTAQLEDLQKLVFPTLADDELIKAIHYRKHLELFPEGQFVITDNDRVIGMTTTMRSSFDFSDYHHNFKETIAGGWMTNHNPEGDWLYGLDIGIHPAYRGQGLARILYRARQETARQLGLKGQLTVGMMSGYGKVSQEISGEDYYRELIKGKRFDPTISAQLKIGFEPVALLAEYVNDPVCGNYGVLIKLDISREV